MTRLMSRSLLQLVDDAGELAHHGGGELVDLLAGKIEPDDGQIAVALDAKRARRDAAGASATS